MVTSAEFDEVLVPYDWQNNVLMRTFDSLIGFNKKKNKKGKSMKPIKEEWENGRWVAKTSEQKKADALHKSLQSKINSGAIKVVNLDKKKKPEADKKTGKIIEPKENKMYQGHLINKVGKTEAQIKKELSAKNSSKIKKEFKDPGDTHYTVKEIADIVFPRSAKTREVYISPNGFMEALIRDKDLRKKWDEKVIKYKGHKEEKKGRKVSTKSEKAEDAKLETDLSAIANWFWKNRNDKSFKAILGDDLKSYSETARRIKNDERGLKYFAKIMKMAGYEKEEEKPFDSKPRIVKESTDDCLERFMPAIKKIQKTYKNKAVKGTDMATGIEYTMRTLFGLDWKRI